MKLVFWGTPQFAVPTLQRLLDEPFFQVLGVVTQPDKRRGRGNEVMPSPVKALAAGHGLSVWQPRNVKKDAATLEQLRSLQADAFVVVAYGQILSSEILAMPRLGCINGHGSLLPKYRGAAPIQWAVYCGERVTGITTMLMDTGMDTGAMLLKGEISIALLDNANDIAARLADLSADLMVETLRQLERHALKPVPQDAALATYAPLITKADYRLDWHKVAIALHNQVRGFTPNCVAQFRGERLKIVATVPLHEAVLVDLPEPYHRMATEVLTMAFPAQPPGTIVQVLKNWGPVVQTGEGLILIHSLQPAGKRLQSGWDFVNGLRVGVGDRMDNGLET